MALVRSRQRLRDTLLNAEADPGAKIGYLPAMFARHMLRPWFSRWILRWLIGAMLFTQLAIAAYACPVIGNALADDSVAMTGMPCAEVVVASGSLDAAQPGLCLQHCQYGSNQQVADPSALAPLPVAALAALFELAPAPLATTLAGPGWAVRERSRDRAPPVAHYIAHCCHRL